MKQKIFKMDTSTNISHFLTLKNNQEKDFHIFNFKFQLSKYYFSKLNFKLRNHPDTLICKEENIIAVTIFLNSTHKILN